MWVGFSSRGQTLCPLEQGQSIFSHKALDQTQSRGSRQGFEFLILGHRLPAPGASFWGDFPSTKLVLISENYLMQAHFNISLKLNIIKKIDQLLKKSQRRDTNGF